MINLSVRDYRSINKVDTLTASQRLGHLRDLGLLLQRGKGPSTFYLLFDHSIASVVAPDLFSQTPAENESQQPQEQSGNLDDLIGSRLYPESDALYPFLQEMPQNLRDDVLQLSQRTSPERLRDLIIRLCRHRDWQAEELSHLLNRDKSYLVKFYLRPLRQAGILKYAQQAYSAVRSEES